ncbi:MAG TPA: phosphoribosylglycinamide synthetase C domain-containing protein [Candidatus Bilamarchaeaceae archaeon]|nr:phosphoribosylglycinamide synthetase C domain-containing protein [Candidatus Bilamarchaeaceae archaeon]
MVEQKNGSKFEPKKFLFVSIDALISDIAWQTAKEGHQVKYYIQDKDYKDSADGFVEKTEDWKKEIGWADIIIFDDVLGQGEKAEKIRKEGKLVIGGTAYTDKLEDERSFGQEQLKKNGVNVLPFYEFTDFNEAIEFVKNNPNRYVIKPSGEAQNRKSLLFVGEEDNGADVIRVLESYNKVLPGVIKSFQLQKRISGVEIAVGAFFNGKKFITPININFEHKKLFPGDLGPPTGEMGTTCFWSEPNRLFTATLQKMETTLASEGYIGYIDLNCIVNANGIYPLEFTSRFGYPTISIQQEGIAIPIGEFLYNLASGEDFVLKTKKGFQIGVRIVVPPFPFKDKIASANAKNSTIIFKKPDFNGIHIEDVKLVNGEWALAGESGVVLIVVGTGQTMKEAQKQAYHRIRNILIPHMYYRTDIGDRWFEDSDKLHNWGYLREG